MRIVRPCLAAAAPAVVAFILAASPAGSQCSYPTLADDTPQVFSSSPQPTRFTQSVGRWAAVAVQSAGTANWDIGISLSTAAFPTCVSLPVIASQQPSGVDFVLGDFAAEGTGTRHAPILRASGTGNATLEWDSGSRTALVNGGGYNGGGGTGMLIDCWNVDLVGGTSYRVRLSGDQPGDYTLHVFRRGPSNSWRQKSDALVSYTSNLSFSPVLTAPATDRYAFVVVRETATTWPYVFSIVTCVDPPHLNPHASLPIPVVQGIFESAFQFEPGGSPGFPTVAARAGQDGDWYRLTVAKHVDPGYWPCEGLEQAQSGVSGNRVELLVGDQVSGAVTPGGSWWLGTNQSTNVEGRVEYSPGTDVLVPDAAPLYIQGGPEMVVRTFRADLVAGGRYMLHTARCGPATGRLYQFRPWDPAFPSGNGWSGLEGDHAPVLSWTVDGVNDIQLLVPVSGTYAFVLTNETGENACFELGISSCFPRLWLTDRWPVQTSVDPPSAPYAGLSAGTIHNRGGWTAVATRPFALGEDWVVEGWDAPSGGGNFGQGLFACVSGLLDASTEDGTQSPTDFVARYEAVAPLAERVATWRIYPAAGTTPGGGAYLLYEQWNTILSVGDPVNQYPVTDFRDLIEVWNLNLVAGQPVQFLFDPVGFAGELFLFRPQSDCQGECPPEFAHPGSSGMEFRTTTDVLFTPTETATYGLVVVNKDGGTGKFWLAVSPTTVDAGPGPLPGPATRTRFVGASPNPLTASVAARLEFELAQPARVGFDVVNLAGRVVARVEEAPHAAGRGSVAWTPRGLAAGLYFARMRVDGAVVPARAKLTVLP